MMVTGLLIFTLFGMASAAVLPLSQPRHPGFTGGTRPGRPVGPDPIVGPPTPLPEPVPIDQLFSISVIGVITFDRHYCVFQGAMGQLTGPPDLEIGDSAEFDVEQGTATLRTGRTITVGDGSVSVRILHPRNTAAITRALSRAGLTLAEFIQQIGTSLPEAGVIEVTSGVLSIGGTYKNIKAGVLILVSKGVGPQPGIYEPPQTGYAPPQVYKQPEVIYGEPQDSLYGARVTETAAPVTVTNYESFTLTKTSTYDNYVTITSPVYNSAAVTSTNFVRKNSIIYDEEVIKSPLPGSIIVNTITIYYTTFITVTDTATNFFIQTNLETVTSTLQHISSNFSFRTVTSNSIATTSVTATITRTSIATIYVTATVGEPRYVTTHTVITITQNPGIYQTQTPTPYSN